MKIKLLIIFVFIFGLISCSEEKINTTEISKNQEENMRELENIKIDEYNFKQLEKVKSILDGLEEDSYSFENLKEFNETFNQDIIPIMNCYYLSSNNGKESYLFGFQLYSNQYKENYNNTHISYPKYNLTVDYACDGGISCKNDISLNHFIYTISNPCNN